MITENEKKEIMELESLVKDLTESMKEVIAKQQSMEEEIIMSGWRTNVGHPSQEV